MSFEEFKNFKEDAFIDFKEFVYEDLKFEQSRQSKYRERDRIESFDDLFRIVDDFYLSQNIDNQKAEYIYYRILKMLKDENFLNNK